MEAWEFLKQKFNIGSRSMLVNDIVAADLRVEEYNVIRYRIVDQGNNVWSDNIQSELDAKLILVSQQSNTIDYCKRKLALLIDRRKRATHRAREFLKSG